MTKARDLASGGFGLVLVKPSSVVNGTDNGKGTVSFSAVSSVSLNDVFSATYENYRIVVTGNISANLELRLRYRVNGSDNTSAVYNYQKFQASNTTLTATRVFSATFLDINIWDTSLSAATLEVYRPFLTDETTSYCIGGANGIVANNFAGRFTSSTSFTGFTLFPSSGTVTGKVSVYGYNN